MLVSKGKSCPTANSRKKKKKVLSTWSKTSSLRIQHTQNDQLLFLKRSFTHIPLSSSHRDVTPCKHSWAPLLVALPPPYSFRCLEEESSRGTSASEANWAQAYKQDLVDCE